LREHRHEEVEAFRICKERILALNLNMKLVIVHRLLEDQKLLFFFTANGRVDFRELVKDLVGVFKTRIELRQIGIRDESRILGGLGICGRSYCCHQISDKLKPVSIKMAKEQRLSLNSMKVSGPCGRLLCCIGYEHEFYCEQRCLLPTEGCRVMFQGESWRIIEANAILGMITIAAEDGRQMRLPKTSFSRQEKTDSKSRCNWVLNEESVPTSGPRNGR
jgi:cell fate regulator YaaT (PSP1 superfamily)